MKFADSLRQFRFFDFFGRGEQGKEGRERERERGREKTLSTERERERERRRDIYVCRNISMHLNAKI